MRSSPLALNSLRLAASSSRKSSQLLQHGLPRLRNTIAVSTTKSHPVFTQSRTMVSATQTSEKPHNAWLGSKGPAAFDLRSDTITTPTPSMLQAIQSCTLLDDVFREDPATNDLEAYVASRTGKEAGLFVLSGTMGNQLALRSLLTQPPYSVLCDYRAHIFTSEAGGVCSLSGAQVMPVVPKNGRYLTLEDVKANVTVDDDVHGCPTRVISLENTLHGMVTPLSEIKRISEFARGYNIKMHCDGARLWEAVISGAGSLPDFCSHFDTISLCLSKGLGAPVGSVLVGPKDVLKHSRWVRKSIGGGIRQAGVLTSAGRVAIDETFGKSPNGDDGMLKASHQTALKVDKLWKSLGGKMEDPTETNMCWLDLEAAGCSEKRFNAVGEEAGLKLMGGRLVTHYQVAQNEEEVLKRLEVVFKRIFSETEKVSSKDNVGQASVYVSR